MDISIHVLFICVLCFSLLSINLARSEKVNDEDKCEKISPCLCDFQNGIVLDISTVGSEGFINTTTNAGTNLTYYFHGCTNEKLHLTFPNTTNECDTKASALCVHDANKHLILSLGTVETLKFDNTNDEPKSHELIFLGNKTTSSVQLVCTPELTRDVLFDIGSSADGVEHRLVLESHKVCRQAIDHGMGFGSTILLLFVVGFAVYFIGGAIALHCLRGANGLEMIPNLEFWRELPNLCRDGFLYLISGCKTTQVSTSETYDRI